MGDQTFENPDTKLGSHCHDMLSYTFAGKISLVLIWLLNNQTRPTLHAALPQGVERLQGCGGASAGKEGRRPPVQTHARKWAPD